MPSLLRLMLRARLQDSAGCKRQPPAQLCLHRVVEPCLWCAQHWHCFMNSCPAWAKLTAPLSEACTWQATSGLHCQYSDRNTHNKQAEQFNAVSRLCSSMRLKACHARLTAPLSGLPSQWHDVMGQPHYGGIRDFFGWLQVVTLYRWGTIPSAGHTRQ